MKQDFDFNEIGKRTPYRIPDGFFERMQAETLQKVVEEKRRKRLYRLKWGVSVALAVAAMICGIVFFPMRPEVEQEGNVTGWLATNAGMQDMEEIYFQGLSDEELEGWIEFSENDIYYELTNQNLNEDED